MKTLAIVLFSLAASLACYGIHAEVSHKSTTTTPVLPSTVTPLLNVKMDVHIVPYVEKPVVDFSRWKRIHA